MRFGYLTIGAIAGALLAGAAVAQESSEECLRLEAQLAGLPKTPRGQDPRALEQSAARIQNDLDRNQAYAKGIGCGRRFIFAPDPPAECGPLEAKIRQLQISLDRTRAQAAQAAQSGGGQDPRRRELLFALARNQCGPQYRLVERRVVHQGPEKKKGFFEMLFGGGGGSESREETVLEPEMNSPDGGGEPRVSTYRTVCVRTCDGFFFPISYQTSRNAFSRDEAICKATCPGSEAKLYAYGNPGGKMENAADVDGEPYTKLENAFRYRKEFVAGCSCKPEGMNWAEALSGVEDKTVKKGDIVVDEQTADRMSRAHTPEEQAAIRSEAVAKARAARRERKPEPAAEETAGSQGQARFDPPTGAAPRHEAPADDVIVLDQPPLRRDRIEGRPLDGPTMERIPD